MAAPKAGPGDSLSKSLDIDGFELANSGPFMDSLLTFLNEASICMREVKQRVGISPDCPSSVPMNDEERRDKMDAIVTMLSHKCNLELKKDESSMARGKSNCPGPANAELFMPSSSSRHMSRGKREQPEQLFAGSSYGRQGSSYARMTPRPGAARMVSPRHMAEEYSAFDGLPPAPSSRSYGRPSDGRGCAPDCPQLSNSPSRQRYRR